MAFRSVILALFALVLVQPLLSKGDDDVCSKVDCGKGKCQASPNTTYKFVCACDHGWKRTHSDDDNGLEFLPCVVPNCTMNYSCSNSPTPAPVPQKPPTSKSIFDVCHWVTCGAGTCVRTSFFHHKCECDAGYVHLLNETNLPCIKECSFGMDCAALGISINTTTGASAASSILEGRSLWMVMLVALMTKLYLH